MCLSIELLAPLNQDHPDPLLLLDGTSGWFAVAITLQPSWDRASLRTNKMDSTFCCKSLISLLQILLSLNRSIGLCVMNPSVQFEQRRAPP